MLGPMWAFLFAGERSSLLTLFGGGIILFAALLQFYKLIFNDKKEIISWLSLLSNKLRSLTK